MKMIHLRLLLAAAASAECGGSTPVRPLPCPPEQKRLLSEFCESYWHGPCPTYPQALASRASPRCQTGTCQGLALRYLRSAPNVYPIVEYFDGTGTLVAAATGTDVVIDDCPAGAAVWGPPVACTESDTVACPR